MKRLLLFSIVVLCNSLSALAQCYSIKGTVMDDKTNEPISRVNVIVRQSADNSIVTFATTADNGTFSLHISCDHLADSRNQQAYLELARRVSYKEVLRERLVPHAIEALFLGASGLLNLYEPDDYTSNLMRTFQHLSAKYQIEPMSAKEWAFHGVRPANHPVLRLAEAAEFFAQDDFVMDRTMNCRTEADVRKFFCVEASEYWLTHHIPGSPSEERPKRIGNFKANIIGINLVAVLQFAYGSYIGKESLRDNALTLLEALEAENNRYTRGWYNATGLDAKNAFESQSLLQLATQYCPEKRCEECPLGRRILHKVLQELQNKS